jgi:hypothetical protein
MPPHSSHLLQPLDISCFSVLKRSYGTLVQEQMRAGINYINKDDFLELYRRARNQTYRPNTIQSGFRATGLVPFNPDEVLTRLHIQLRTPSPPCATTTTTTTTTITTTWTSETPHNVVELEEQTKTVKTLIRYRTQSPPSPTVKAIDQIIKGCALAMNEKVLLADEVTKLRAANARVVKKRQKKKSYVGNKEVRSVAEVQQAQEQHTERVEEEIVTVEETTSTQLVRPLRMCSMCRSTEHTARTCNLRGNFN